MDHKPETEETGLASRIIKTLGALLLAVVGAIVAEPILGILFPGHPSPPPTPATSQTPIVESPATSTSPEASYAPEAVLLTELDHVESTLDIDFDETLTLGGESHLHSIEYSCNSFCNDSPGSIEYDLGRQYSTFTATIGVNDRAGDAEQVGQFIAYVDGVESGRWTTKLGEPEAIEISVRDGLRLRLDWGIEGVVDPMQAGINAAGGVSTPLPDLIWGSPTLTR